MSKLEAKDKPSTPEPLEVEALLARAKKPAADAIKQRTTMPIIAITMGKNSDSSSARHNAVAPTKIGAPNATPRRKAEARP